MYAFVMMALLDLAMLESPNSYVGLPDPGRHEPAVTRPGTPRANDRSVPPDYHWGMA